MCTTSWIHQDDGFTLFFNRDEARDRASGLPPRLLNYGGVRALAPRDGKAGGTWIFVNEAGCAGMVLNDYPKPGERQEQPHPSCTSRGNLLHGIVSCATPGQVEDKLKASLASNRFQPFRLLFLIPGGEAIWTWNGERLIGPAVPVVPVTTSSWNSKAVEAARHRAYSRLIDRNGLNPASLEDYHLSRDPMDDAFSVLMDRPDARTVSVCRVIVDATEVRMSYKLRLSGQHFTPFHSSAIPRVRAAEDSFSPRSLRCL